jgi:hypothetical protein
MGFCSGDPERPNCLPISSGNQSGSWRDCVYLVLMYAAVISQHWFGTKRAKLRRCFAGFCFIITMLFHQWLQTKHWFTNDIRMIIWQCISSQVVIKTATLITYSPNYPQNIDFTDLQIPTEFHRKETVSCTRVSKLHAKAWTLHKSSHWVYQAYCPTNSSSWYCHGWLEICRKILTTFPGSLHYFRCSFESCPIADWTLENLTSRLVREEERLNLTNGGLSSADQAFFGEHET